MEGIITLVFILVIAIFQSINKKKQKIHPEKKVRRKPVSFRELEEPLILPPENEVQRLVKDKKEVHEADVDKKEAPLHRLQRLSTYKKAIIWAEILGPPRSLNEYK